MKVLSCRSRSRPVDHVASHTALADVAAVALHEDFKQADGRHSGSGPSGASRFKHAEPNTA